jgi:hypothetical protein
MPSFRTSGEVYELGVDARPGLTLAAAFDVLALVI